MPQKKNIKSLSHNSNTRPFNHWAQFQIKQEQERAQEKKNHTHLPAARRRRCATLWRRRRTSRSRIWRRRQRPRRGPAALLRGGRRRRRQPPWGTACTRAPSARPTLSRSGFLAPEESRRGWGGSTGGTGGVLSGVSKGRNGTEDRRGS
jgi:hypothetical protein